MAEKLPTDHLEDAKRAGSDVAPDDAKHGDRALAIIGSERVSLTEEDV